MDTLNVPIITICKSFALGEFHLSISRISQTQSGIKETNHLIIVLISNKLITYYWISLLILLQCLILKLLPVSKSVSFVFSTLYFQHHCISIFYIKQNVFCFLKVSRIVWLYMLEVFIGWCLSHCFLAWRNTNIKATYKKKHFIGACL